MANDRRELWIMFGIIAATVAYSRLLRAPCDDAYIFYVYANNWLAGNGPTFNGARVEGFTSPLWLLLLTAAGFVKIPLPVAGEVLGTFSGLLALLATHRLARAAGLAGVWALLPVGLLAASGDFVFYMASGLALPLFTAFVAWSTAAVLEAPPAHTLRSPRFAALVAGMILTRPEGALVAALLYGYGWVATRSPRLVLAAGVRTLALLLPVLALKAWYYGYPLPNTYYAKSGAGFANVAHGLRYLGAAVPRHLPLLLLLLPAALDRSRTRAASPARPLPFLFASTAVWLASIALQGGDNMVGARVVVPALPWLCVGLVALAGAAKPAATFVAVGIASAGMVLGYARTESVRIHAEGWRADAVVREAAGRYLGKHFPPDTLVALNPAGSIPFYSELPTIDMLGLNDEHIAHRGARNRKQRFGHQAGDGAYVLSRRPDVILLGS
ncbi:MAG: hypothetical protein ACE5FL_12925, partial [Myxococcota bacterium]